MRSIPARTSSSFGLVLYELLAGKRAFSAETPVETMTAILKTDPAPISSLAPSTPPILDAIVRRCIERNPAERYQSIQDVAFILESATSLAGPSFPCALGFTAVTLPANPRTVCRDSARAYYFCSPNTPPKALAGVAPNDVLLAVSGDRRSVFVTALQSSAVRAAVEGVDGATGRRQPWLDLKPPDTSGLQAIRTLTISADGNAYFHATRRMFTELFVVEGLR